MSGAVVVAADGHVVGASPLPPIDPIALETGDGVVTIVTNTPVDGADPQLRAHFPGQPIFPGAFILERVRQAVATAMGSLGVDQSFLCAVRSARFLAPLYPGDEMRLGVRVTTLDDGTGRVEAEASHDGVVAARVKVECGPRPDTPGATAGLDHAGIRSLLPHGHPMLLVDRVVALEPGRSIVAIKAVTATESCYRDLPAGAPSHTYAYPAALMLESFGQAAALLWRATACDGARTGGEAIMLTAARNCRIEGAAYPGDVIRHEARVDNIVGDTVLVGGEIWIGDTRIAAVECMMATARAPQRRG